MSTTQDDDVTREEILDVLEGGTPYERLINSRLQHLLDQCRECRLGIGSAFADHHGWVEDESANTEWLEVIVAAIKLGPEGLERWGQMEADELLSVGPEDRRELLEAKLDHYRAPVLVDELLARCESQVTQDPARALELAELAVEISLRCDPEAFGSLAFHARARAEAHRANCLRLQDDPQTAEESFRHAYELHSEANVADPEVEAEVCHLEASLAIDQRRFEEAERLLDHARELYRSLDKPQAVARTWINHANLQYHRGQPAAGLPALGAAASLLDLERDAQLHLTIRYSQALYAVEAGDVELAERHFEQHRELLESRAEPWFALRVLWLRAKIAQAKGWVFTAHGLYSRAREGFLAEGLGYDAAQVSLELALLELDAGDFQAVQDLAAEMLSIFQAQDVHREALAALVLFERAARTEELTADFVLHLRRYLQLARRDPTLKLEHLR